MIVLRTVRELRDAVREARGRAERIGLVPTMGALHDGHLSLMRRAGAQCGFVVVSLFVNPAQFTEAADLAGYPRDEDRDASLCAAAGVSVLFAPAVDDVYPGGFATGVEVTGLTAPLEGAMRGPEHFRGVTTVVTKLLNMAQPDDAFFGQKDAQQTLIIQRLVLDLDLPVRVEVCPTVREPDGLAMSSRNALLDTEARRRAVALSQSLFAIADVVAAGETNAHLALAAGQRILSQAHITPEYLAAASMDTLAPVETIAGETLVAIAARVGGVRLIDNVIVGGRSASA